MTGGDRAASGRWGILGGTFDPIHYAHLAIAEQTREALDLAGVLFLPAGDPPHKQGAPVSEPHHRAAMIEAAIAGNPWFRLCRAELDRPGPSYLVDTLEGLRSAPEGREGLVFILSAEAVSAFRTWRDPERILDLAQLAVVPRLGHLAVGRDELAQWFPGRAHRLLFLDGPILGHAASDIRRRVREGRTIRYLVPPEVEAYIDRYGLYRDATPIERDHGRAGGRRSTTSPPTSATTSQGRLTPT